MSQRFRPSVFHDGVLDLIGNTPLVRIRKLWSNPKVEIWAKVESTNPGGSIKDRIAKGMVEAGEASGELTKDKTILEATSGNTGIGLALVGTVKGYKVMLAMSEAVSEERRKTLSALGAEFLLTPAHLGTDGAIEVVYRLRRREPDKYFVPDQYNNPANPMAHYLGTAQEIIDQTEGRLTHFVATMGTTGTLMGCGKRLKEFNPNISIIGVEPYLGHKIQGLKNMKEAYRPGIFDKSILTQKINVGDEDAYETARLLAREEGLFVGMSSGAALYAALNLAKTLEAGVIVVILPDGGERYLSTTLFQAVSAPRKERVLNIYNTLTKSKMPFKPLVEGQVTIYSCGPTVQAEPHLGLFRRVVTADILVRYLEYLGFNVKHIMNITDIDDNTIETSEKLGIPLKTLTDMATEAFFRDLDCLSIKRAYRYPRASEHVEDMIAFTKHLIDKGYAYERFRSVYFNIGKAEDYGCLSGIDMTKIKIGVTVDLDEYEKDSPRDFTLFKRATLAEMKRDIFFETEWGNVRPGWHIECAVMSTKYLGEEFDIHTSGTDLIFPHNENEIALCRAAYGKHPARYWIHTEMVMVGGKKMSRSLGSAMTLSDCINKGFSPRDVRFSFLSTHYRQPMTLSEEILKASHSAIKRIDTFLWHLLRCNGGGVKEETKRAVNQMITEFEDAMSQDLNVPMAIGSVFSMIKSLNPLVLSNRISSEDSCFVVDALKKVDSVLGIFDFSLSTDQFDPEIEKLIQERELARQRGDYETADNIREKLRNMGIYLEDTVHGVRSIRENGR